MRLERDPTLRFVHRFVERLGETTLLDLFDRHQIPEQVRLGFLATTLAEVIDEAHPAEVSAARAIWALEANCRAHAESLASPLGRSTWAADSRSS
jgi:hypothetical protein